jgi:two-component system chemotaxis response regulator CheB
MNSRKIRVLVVDDSLVFRETIARGISKDKGIEVVATASDPFMARDKIIEFEPDVMTLDVEMPKMDGIEFLRRLMPQYPLPVVVVSAVSSNVFDALNAGAVDFVTKPDAKNGSNMDSLINELVIKIKIASTAKLGHWKNTKPNDRVLDSTKARNKDIIIAIGASTGGTEAIYEVIRKFPEDMPGVVIVQHMPPVFTRMYAERLNNTCSLNIKEAKTGDLVVPGTVLIAPGDSHMRIRRGGGVYSVECFKGDKVNGHCPSVDVLFDSVSKIAGKNAIGIILTGMGYDGAKGLLEMRHKGARTIGQDEASSVVYGMPKVAYDIGAVEKQATINDIARIVYSIVKSAS